jgi:hypothetical protein
VRRVLLGTVVIIGVAILVAPAAHALSKQEVVRRVFRHQGAVVAAQAVRVSGCESAGDATGSVIRPWATNGQYEGAFQLGEWARSRFLRGAWWNLWRNAEAALRLFLWNGRSWDGQWSCSWVA